MALYEEFEINITTFNEGSGNEKSDIITSSAVVPNKEEHDNAYIDFGSFFDE